MGVYTHVHAGIIVKIKLKPKPFDVTVRACPTVGCDDHAKEKPRKFCSACGSAIQDVTITQHGTVTWDDFMESRDWEDEDVFYQPCDYFSDVDGYQVLLYNYDTGIDLDPDSGNIVTVEALKQNAYEAVVQVTRKHGELIDAAREFFGDRFSLDYGVASYWH